MGLRVTGVSSAKPVQVDQAQAEDPTSFLPVGNDPVEPQPIEPSRSPAVETSELVLPVDNPSTENLYNSLSTTSADENAKVIDLSNKTGQPTPFVQKNLQQVERIGQAPPVSFFADLEKNYPGTTKFLSVPNNMSMAHDDMENLTKIEQNVNEYSVAWKALAAFNKGAAGMGASIARVPNLAASAVLFPYNKAQEMAGGEQINYPASNPVADFLDRQAASYGTVTPEMNESVVGEIAKGNYKKAGESAAYQVVAQIPQLMAQFATAGGSKVAQASSLVGLGAMSAADKNKELVDKGISPAAALPDALATGTIESATESLGTFAFIENMSKALVQKAGRQGALEVFKSMGKVMLAGGATEGTEEAVGQFAQGMLDYGTGLDPDALKNLPENVLNAGLLGALTGGVATGPGTTIKAANIVASERQTTLAKEMYIAMGDSMEATKLRKRLPEAQKNYIETVTKGSPVENIYLSTEAVERFFQSQDESPAQVMRELGLEEGYNEAKLTGDNVKIPLADFANKFVGTPAYEALANDIKFDPDSLSVNEMEADKKLAGEQVATADKEAKPLTADEQIVQSGKAVQEDVAAQLKAINQDPKQAVLFRGFEILGKRAGIDPLELYQRYKLKIGDGTVDPNAPDIFDQVIAAQNAEAPVDASPEEMKMFQEQKAETKKELMDLAKAAIHAIPDVSTDAVAEAFGLPAKEVRFLAKGSKRSGKKATGTYSKEEIRAAVNADSTRLFQSKENAPAFYSKMIQTIEQKMGNSATVEQINGMLKEIKPEERKWMGLDEILKGKEKLSKDELLANLRGNQVEIKDVTKGKTGIDTSGYSIEEGPEKSKFRYSVRDSSDEPVQSFKTREEAQSFIDNGAAKDTTKFSQYTLPGGDNYREVLFTLPEQKGSAPAFSEWMKSKGYEESEKTKRVAEYQKEFPPQEKQIYKSSHFDEANVLAHTRLNDRVDADGKKVLFVEEIQSDWHQEGRKSGYQGEQDPTKLPDGYWVESNNPEQINVRDSMGRIGGIGTSAEAAIADFWRSQNKVERKVPDAPLRKTWHEFVLKKLIREAAEKGYDKIAWTTGEQQADRYDLSKQVDRVNAFKTKDGTYNVEAVKGRDIVSEKDGVKESELESLFGKDLAEKIKAESGTQDQSGYRKYEGKDLKVGGEGMKGFYDKILVDAANKFGKKYGAKVGDSEINSSNKKMSLYVGEMANGRFGVFDKNELSAGSIPTPIDDFSNKAAAESYINSNESNRVVDGVKVHSLEITPALKDAALNEGFSLFQPGEGSAPRGQITFGSNRQFNIDILKDANKSTFIHETGHFYVEVMSDLSKEIAAMPEADRTDQQKQLVEDHKTLLEWAGATPGEPISTESHEKIARGFEKYLFEGKAPTSALRSAFARFRIWLVSVYKALGPNAELSNDVRDVLDRLLASDEEIAAVQLEQNQQPLFSDPKFQGMSIEKTKEYLKAAEEAREYAVSEINRKLFEHHDKVRSQVYKEEKEALLPVIDAQVSELPVYKTIDKMQNEKTPSGEPIKIAPESLEKYGKNVAKSLPEGTVAEKGQGLDVETAAELLLYENANNLVSALSSAKPKQEVVNDIADKEMEIRFPDLRKTNLHEEVVRVVHNNSRAKMLRIELEHLASNNMPVLKEAIRRVARRVPTEAAVRAQAEQMIAGKKVGDISPSQYKRAEAKAAKEAGVLLAKGDINGAFEAKQRELLNHELFIAASTANEVLNKSLKNFKKLTKSNEDLAKSRDIDMVNAARSILAMHGIGKAEQAPESYIAKIQAYDPATYETVKALIDSASGVAGDYESLTYDQFLAMRDSVLSIWDLSKEIKEIQIDGKKVSVETAVADLNARLSELDKGGDIPGKDRAITDKEKRSMAISSLTNIATRVEHWAYAMDKGNVNGPFTKYIVRPILQGTANYRVALASTMKDLSSIVGEFDIKSSDAIIEAPELNYQFTKPELIMAVLHSGNDSNLQKLLVGRGWGTLDENGVLDRSRWDAFINRAYRTGLVTKADMDAAQKVWDLNEKLKPDAQKAHKALTGFYFNEITANPVLTPFGVYRGGYMPAIADPNLSVDTSIRASQKELEETPMQMFPTTGKGFTKSRIDAYSTPLSLDLTKIKNHMDKVLRFSHIEVPVRDASKVLNNKAFRTQLNKYDISAANDLITPWLKRAATQSSSTPGVSKYLDRGLSLFRRTSSIQFMVLNVINSIQNTLSVFPAMVRVEPKHLAGSFKRYLENPSAYAENIMGLSKYMQTRIGENSSEISKQIDDQIVNPTKIEELRDTAIKYGYILDRATNGMMETIIWGAAHEEEIAKGSSEQDAINFADATVRQVTAAANPEDISRYESGSPFVKLFTMFSTFFNTQANLLQAEARIALEEGGAAGAARAARAYSLVVMVPAIASAMIYGIMSGRGLDEDDDGSYIDDVIDIMFGSQYRFAMAMIPGGNIITNITNRLNNKPYDDKISLSPAISSIEKAFGSVSSVPKAISGGGNTSKAIKEGMTALGLVTGLPIAPLSKPLGFAADLSEGKVRSSGPVDVARGLITGTGDRK